MFRKVAQKERSRVFNYRLYYEISVNESRRARRPHEGDAKRIYQLPHRRILRFAGRR